MQSSACDFSLRAETHTSFFFELVEKSVAPTFHSASSRRSGMRFVKRGMAYCGAMLLVEVHRLQRLIDCTRSMDALCLRLFEREESVNEGSVIVKLEMLGQERNLIPWCKRMMLIVKRSVTVTLQRENSHSACVLILQ